MKTSIASNRGVLLPALRGISTAAILTIALAGCDPVSLTVFGVGGAAGVSHQMGGIAYRTFTEPLPKVKRATLGALQRMAIKVSDTSKTETGELIKATASNRDIEIEFESLTPTTTRMRAIARKDGGIFVDAATAFEIITQTERMLERT
jgi:hypothetical protein